MRNQAAINLIHPFVFSDETCALTPLYVSHCLDWLKDHWKVEKMLGGLA